MSNLLNLQVFVMWEETRPPRGNPCGHRKNLQTPLGQTHDGTWSCEDQLQCAGWAWTPLSAQAAVLVLALYPLNMTQKRQNLVMLS